MACLGVVCSRCSPFRKAVDLDTGVVKGDGDVVFRVCRECKDRGHGKRPVLTTKEAKKARYEQLIRIKTRRGSLQTKSSAESRYSGKHSNGSCRTKFTGVSTASSLAEMEREGYQKQFYKNGGSGSFNSQNSFNSQHSRSDLASLAVPRNTSYGCDNLSAANSVDDFYSQSRRSRSFESIAVPDTRPRKRAPAAVQDSDLLLQTRPSALEEAEEGRASSLGPSYGHAS